MHLEESAPLPGLKLTGSCSEVWINCSGSVSFPAVVEVIKLPAFTLVNVVIVKDFDPTGAAPG